MTEDFTVGNRAYLTDRGRILYNIIELPFVNEHFTIRLPFALEPEAESHRKELEVLKKEATEAAKSRPAEGVPPRRPGEFRPGVVMQASLSELDVYSESEEFETELNILKLEKLEIENKIKLLEENMFKRKFDNVIKHIESRGYCESLIRKDVNTLFPTRLFAFGFELESFVPYSTERNWNGKLTRMDFKLDFVMCVFDDIFPILIDMRFLTKLDSKLIEQFETDEWNSPDLLMCLSKQEEMNNKYVYCCIEENN